MSNHGSNRNSIEMVFKIVIVGDASVGKTNIIYRYLHDKPMKDIQSTIGVELNAKEYEFEGNKIKMQIWDTAGQEKFQSLSTAYYKGAQGFVLVYDITNRKSFENIDNWYSKLKSTLEYSTDLEILLIGNKCDLEDKREVKKEEGEKKARQLTLLFNETSSIDGTNIKIAFDTLAFKVYERNKKKFNPEIKLSLEEQNEKKTDSGWCNC